MDENAPAGTAAGAPVTASDPNGDTLAYSLTGSDAFETDQDGTVRNTRELDFENADSHTLILTATDEHGASGQTTVTVTVNNLDEPGTVTLTHNTPRTGDVITAALSDPDGDTSSETWQWSRAGNDISGGQQRHTHRRRRRPGPQAERPSDLHRPAGDRKVGPSRNLRSGEQRPAQLRPAIHQLHGGRGRPSGHSGRGTAGSLGPQQRHHHLLPVRRRSSRLRRRRRRADHGGRQPGPREPELVQPDRHSLRPRRRLGLHGHHHHGHQRGGGRKRRLRLHRAA